LTPTGVLELQRTEGNRAVVRRLAEPNSVQRDKSAPGTTTADAAVPPVQYEVGGVKYPEDGFSAAVGQIGDLWTASNGILAKQKEAVAEFCGTGGAAATDEGSLTDALLTAALMSLLTVATDGLGTAVAGTLMKVVTVAAKHVAVDPEVVLKMGEKVVEKVVDVGKDKAKEAVTGAVTASHTKTPTGGTKLATPLATYQSALDAVLDADASAMKQKTLNEVLQLPSTPPAARWAAAAAIYAALESSLAEIKRRQWDATSDGWFSTQTATGIDTFKDVDSGIVSIMLSGSYPATRMSADGAYLGGPGANETTVETYNERKLGEVGILKRIIMDSGSLGHGILDCAWEVDVGTDGEIIGFPRNHNRYGYDWLAAKNLGLRNIDSSDVTADNVMGGARKIWEELRGESALDLGTKFKVTGVTSGTGSYVPH